MDAPTQVQSLSCLQDSKEALLEIEVRNFVNEFFFGMEEGYCEEHKQHQRPCKTELEQFNMPVQSLTVAPDRSCSITHYTTSILNNPTNEEMTMPSESTERTYLDAHAGAKEVRLDMHQGESCTLEEQSMSSIDRPKHFDLKIVPPFNDAITHVLAKDKMQKQLRRIETFPCSPSKPAMVQCPAGGKTVDQCPGGTSATMGCTSKASCKKPPRPPRPTSDPIRDPLAGNFSEESLKIARFEKSKSKRRKLTALASNAVSVWALIITFFVTIILVLY